MPPQLSPMVTAHENRIHTVEERQLDQSTRLEGVSARLESLQDAMADGFDRIDTRFDKLDTKIDTLAETINATRKEVESLESEQTKLQSWLSLAKKLIPFALLFLSGGLAQKLGAPAVAELIKAFSSIMN